MKKILSTLLALAMLLTLMAFPATAADPVKIIPVAAKSNYDPQDSANFLGSAFDGVATGDWGRYFRPNKEFPQTATKGDASNFYVIADLGSPYNLTELYMKWGTNYATKVAVYGSNDNEAWTEIADLTLSAQESFSEIETAGFYRYVKIEAYGYKVKNCPAILEVAFTGILSSNYEKVSATVVSAPQKKTDATPKENIVDGDVSTKYSSSQYNDSIAPVTNYNVVLELDSVSDVDRLSIVWGGGVATWGHVVPDSYTLYVSEDGTDYTAVTSYTGLLSIAAAGTDSTYTDSDTSILCHAKSETSHRLVLNENDLNLQDVKFIKIEVNSFKYSFSISEIEVYTKIEGGTTEPDEPEAPDTPDTPDASVTVETLKPQSVKASALYTGSATPDKIIDGVTSWSSYYKTQDNQPIGNGTSSVLNFVFDFGKAVNLTEIYMYWGDCKMAKANVYVANTSDEDTVWIPVHAITAPAYVTGSYGQYFTESVTQPGYYRYIKIDVTQLNKEGCPALFEATFKGSEKTAAVVNFDVTPKSATSSIAGTNTPAETYDKNNNTYHQMKVASGDGTTELASYVYTFYDSYVFTGISALWGDTRADGVTVYVSDDLDKWGEPVYSTVDSSFTTSAGAYSADYDINNIQGRYVKLVITKTNKTQEAPLTLKEISFKATTAAPNKRDRVYSEGGSIRLAVDAEKIKSGLRFAATVVKYNLGIEGDYAYSDDAEMKFGMFLIPEDMLEGKTLAEYLKGGVQQALDVPARRIYEQDDDYVTYTAVITDIPEKDYDREIVALPYMLQNGEYTYFDEMTRNYKGVALAARSTTFSDSKIMNMAETKKAQYIETAKKLDALTGSATVDVRIMSYNILHPDWSGDSTRVEIPGRDLKAAETILNYMPDVIGLQEVCEEWHLALKPLLVTTGTYKPVCKTFSDGSYNLTTMMYNPKTVTLIEEIMVPLKDNSDIRVMAGGVFEKQGKMFIVVNTHPDTPTSSGNTYTSDIAAIISRANEIMQKYPGIPMFMTGDYNSPKNLSLLYTGYNDIINGTGVRDTRDIAATIDGNYTTCPGRNTKPSTYSSGMSTSIIDYIFANTAVKEVKKFGVIYNSDTTTVSDHLPIYADASFESAIVK